MKIGLVTGSSLTTPGGVTTSFLRVARALTALGCEVDLVCLDYEHKTPFVCDGQNGVCVDAPIAGLPVYYVRPFSTGHENRANASVDMQIALEGLARSRAYDVLHCFYASKTGFMTVYAAKEVGCASVVSVRGNDIHQQIWDPARFGHTLWALQHASSVTAVSTEASRRLRTISGRVGDVCVVLNSVDPDEFDEGIEEMNWSRPVIGTAGVLKSKKGVEFLLSAFARLRDVLPKSTFVLVGDIIEGERLEFASLVDRYELGCNLKVTGFVAHRKMLRYMRCMDVFLHASLYDGCPNVVLEAFLAQVPVVATPAGAVPQLIDDGDNGFLVETPIAMAEAAFTLVRDGSSGIVTAALHRAASMFIPSREANQFAEIYRSVIRR